jgi:hypothetical protein
VHGELEAAAQLLAVAPLYPERYADVARERPAAVLRRP